VPYNTDSLLRHLTNTRPETVGRFNYDYINEDVELKEIFKDTTLYSVVATLYYNMATIDEDPILTKFNFDKDIAEAA
jgi:hypothetical protein